MSNVESKKWPVEAVTVESKDRSISLEKFTMFWTYRGCLCGSRGKISRLIREHNEDEAFGLIPRGEDVHLIDDGAEFLPLYMFVAELTSGKICLDDDYSYVKLCWFTDDVNASPVELTKKALEGCEWEEIAKHGYY
jgi:hypothetical protein